MEQFSGFLGYGQQRQPESAQDPAPDPALAPGFRAPPGLADPVVEAYVPLEARASQVLEALPLDQFIAVVRREMPRRGEKQLALQRDE